MRDDPAVIELVEGARDGDSASWDAIVERYSPLVWAVCVRHRLSADETDDVVATIWLRLVERLGTLREPAALPGWLLTTTRNECLQALRVKQRIVPVETADLPDPGMGSSDEWCLDQERYQALRTAFAALPARCRELLTLLFTEPRPPYAEISARLDIAVGGIGPTRRRCLSTMRAHPVLAALEDGAAAGERVS